MPFNVLMTMLHPLTLTFELAAPSVINEKDRAEILKAQPRKEPFVTAK